MKVFVHGPHNDISKIEFCCDETAREVLFNKIKAIPYPDHSVYFSYGKHKLFKCPNCGAKIEGECRES